MNAVTDMIGRRLDIQTAPSIGTSPTLRRPTPLVALATGIKAIDAIAPWPAGGTVDLLGPAGTGHVVLIAEIAHNTNAVIVAVESAHALEHDSPGRLGSLLHGAARGVSAIVIETPQCCEPVVEYARSVAALVTAAGRPALLAIDAIVTDQIGDDAFYAVAGVADNAVTAIRVAPHARGADPRPPLPRADAATVLSLTDALAGRFPAIDVTACRSTALGTADAETRRIADGSRSILIAANRVRGYLTQPFWMAEEITGISGKAVAAHEATASLRQILSDFGKTGAENDADGRRE